MEPWSPLPPLWLTLLLLLPLTSLRSSFLVIAWGNSAVVCCDETVDEAQLSKDGRLDRTAELRREAGAELCDCTEVRRDVGAEEFRATELSAGYL